MTEKIKKNDLKHMKKSHSATEPQSLSKLLYKVDLIYVYIFNNQHEKI